MEYLDRLLARGERYPDVAGAIEAMIKTRTGQPLPRTEPTELPEATAELIACAAGDHMFGELFDRLGAGARSLLVRASVFRLPVAAEVLAARPGPIAECEAAGLLTIGGGHELAVHPWTAAALHRRLALTQVATAHRQAAGYWLSRAAASADRPRAELEAGYHQRCAAGPDREPVRPAARDVRLAASPWRRRFVRYGVAGALAALAVVLAAEAGRELWVPHLASAETSAAPVTAATAARAQAAAWVAHQVSISAISSCDPAMCAALAQHGIAAGNLLVLRPGASDPLGSDVVLATAAVRGMFGSRLADVYAPEVLASFGTGQARVDVRIVAPDGAARLPGRARRGRRRPAGGRSPAAGRRADHGHPVGPGRAGRRAGRHAPADNPGCAGRPRAGPDHRVRRQRSWRQPGPAAADGRAHRTGRDRPDHARLRPRPAHAVPAGVRGPDPRGGRRVGADRRVRRARPTRPAPDSEIGRTKSVRAPVIPACPVRRPPRLARATSPGSGRFTPGG